eukprot:TRINITY_DN3474_c0_g3_i2.p1 TRINITY_DN3474_c0_g3~~TRINITY_DN3474_c0_g3_i2.p1  ORF type:complete len:152 (-),score=2.57 TRINITY_DN3474_c0_g3_i2:41-496(-)
MSIPEVKGKNIQGTEGTFPDDFGEWNIVLLGWSREQSKEFDHWTKCLDELEAKYSVRNYKFPVIKPVNWLLRKMIDGGMSMGIKDEKERRITYTLYTDPAKFQKDVGVEKIDHITITIVDKKGKILYLDSGDWSKERNEALEAALTKALGK